MRPGLLLYISVPNGLTRLHLSTDMRERMTTSNASSLFRRTGSIRAIVLSDELGLFNIPAACVLFYTLQVVTWSHRVMEFF
jgi:hypothetical protein